MNAKNGSVRVYSVTWKELACALAFILGVVLFLYGANYYDAVVGWTGVILMLGDVVGYVVLEVYVTLAKKRLGQKP